MYRVLVVDDESAIRDGLADGVKWEELGFVLVGTAEDGTIALEEIVSSHPHIVVTDIRMPGMDGIELMRRARDCGENARFIFISGHEEFDYVQEALRLGATDYILKPLEMQKLRSALQTAARSLDTYAQSEEDREATVHAVRRKLLQSVILGGGEPSAGRGDDDRDAHLDSGLFVVATVQMDRFYDRMREDDESTGSVFDLFGTLRDAEIWTVVESPKEFAFSARGSRGDDAVNRANRLLGSVSESARSRGFTVTSGLSRPRAFRALRDGLEESRAAVALRVVHGEDARYTWHDLDERAGVGPSAPRVDTANELVAETMSGNEDAVVLLCERLRSEASAEVDPLSSIQWTASRALSGVERVATQRGQSIEEAIDDPFGQWSLLRDDPTIAAMVSRLETTLRTVARYVRKRQDYHTSQILDQALEYLHVHYNDPQVSLARVASEACLSPCYFSVVFKDVVGINFQRYLVNYRMDRAKDLLVNTSMKTYEISAEVGYENSSYFSTAFKRVSGLSPTEYRSQNS